MCGYGSVIDDAAALGPLMAHHSERLAGAEKDAREVHSDHFVPVFKFEAIDFDRGAPVPALLKRRSTRS
jgi:hypothetical protein